MTDEQGRASEKKGRVKPIDVENVEFEFVRKVERQNKLNGQYSTILSEPCTLHKSSLAEKLTKSVGRGHLYRGQKTLCQPHGCQAHQLRYNECPQIQQL